MAKLSKQKRRLFVIWLIAAAVGWFWIENQFTGGMDIQISNLEQSLKDTHVGGKKIEALVDVFSDFREQTQSYVRGMVLCAIMLLWAGFQLTVDKLQR